MILDILPNSVIPEHLPSSQHAPNCAPSRLLHTHTCTCTHYVRFSTGSQLTLLVTHTHTHSESLPSGTGKAPKGSSLKQSPLWADITKGALSGTQACS